MFDTTIVNGYRVAFIEPNSLVHEVLSFIAAQKIMGILCSGGEEEYDIGGWTRQTQKIENDPSCVPQRLISREFNITPDGINWLYTTNLLKAEVTFEHGKGPTSHCNYVQLTPYGEEVLNDLEKGQEVELYLD